MKTLKNENGSIIVFFTLIVVVLLLIVGMGLDSGNLTYSRKVGQRAVDMAALSAVNGLAIVQSPETAIKNNIDALNNDYIGSDPSKPNPNPIDGQVNPTTGTGHNITLLKYDFSTKTLGTNPVPLNQANALRVSLETNNPYSKENTADAIDTPSFLMPLLNMFGIQTPSSSKVNVSAVAILNALPSLPIALAQNTCNANVGSRYTFILKPSGKNNAAWTTFSNKANVPEIDTLIEQVSNCQGVNNIKSLTNLLNGNPTVPISTVSEGCYLVPVVADSRNFNQSQPILTFAQLCNVVIDTKNNAGITADVKSCDVTNFHDPKLSQCYSSQLVSDPLTENGM